MRILLLLTFLFFAYTLRAQVIVNPSLELWGDSSLCEVNVAPDGWSDFSNGGVGPDECNDLLCHSTVPGHAAAGDDGQVRDAGLTGRYIADE